MTQVPDMWICPKCQAENDSDYTHCRMCGEKNPALPPQEVTCASCGTKHEKGACCPVCGMTDYLKL